MQKRNTEGPLSDISKAMFLASKILLDASETVQDFAPVSTMLWDIIERERQRKRQYRVYVVKKLTLGVSWNERQRRI